MPIVTDGLIAYYNSRQGINGDIWKNISPNVDNKYDGTIIGTTMQEDGAYFDGVDDTVEVQMIPNLTDRHNFTLSFFMKRTISGDTYNILDDGTSNITVMEHSTLDFVIKREFDFISWFGDMSRLKDGVLFCLTFDFENGRLALYVDGEYHDGGNIASTGELFSSNNDTLTIGRNMQGILDNIKIYDRVLTDDEIKQNYSIGREVGLDDKAEEQKEPKPNVIINHITMTKISDETNMDTTELSFSFDKDVTEWTVNVLGVDHTTGTVADSGGSVTANTEIVAVIDWTELYQEGENRVNIYGKDTSGNWTPYSDG